VEEVRDVVESLDDGVLLPQLQIDEVRQGAYAALELITPAREESASVTSQLIVRREERLEILGLVTYYIEDVVCCLDCLSELVLGI
jgi:hypothetical protein